MNREIKFRSWIKVENKMLYDFGLINHPALSDDDKHVLMQYVGLKDKNEKEIYEGDIVKLTSKDYQCYDEYEDIVEFKNGGFYPFVNTLVSGRGTHGDIYELYDFEVIGNIYENKDLLEVNVNE